MPYLHDQELMGFIINYRGVLLFFPEHLAKDMKINTTDGFPLHGLPISKANDDEFQKKLASLDILV